MYAHCKWQLHWQNFWGRCWHILWANKHLFGRPISLHSWPNNFNGFHYLSALMQFKVFSSKSQLGLALNYLYDPILSPLRHFAVSSSVLWSTRSLFYSLHQDCYCSIQIVRIGLTQWNRFSLLTPSSSLVVFPLLSRTLNPAFSLGLLALGVLLTDRLMLRVSKRFISGQMQYNSCVGLLTSRLYLWRLVQNLLLLKPYSEPSIT